MKIWFVVIFLTVMAFQSRTYCQGFIGEISFTEKEKQIHHLCVETITSEATKHLKGIFLDHEEFYGTWGVTKYYGERKYKKNGEIVWGKEETRPYRKIELQTLDVDSIQSSSDLNNILDAQKPTSCVGLALESLEFGFNAMVPFDENGHPIANPRKNEVLAETWTKLNAFVRKNNSSGMPLLYGLQALGWKLCYWNPAVDQSKNWDEEWERVANTSHSSNHPYHSYRWITVNKGIGRDGIAPMSYGSESSGGKLPVDDKTSLVDFGAATPVVLTEAPFFVGIAHGGYHVFPGFGAEKVGGGLPSQRIAVIIEAHSTRSLKAKENLEKSEFNPLRAKVSRVGEERPSGYGPRGDNSPYENYLSGVIALPPIP